MSTLAIVLIVLLVLLLAGGFWGHGSYGASPYYAPGIGLVGLLIVVFLVLVLLGAVHV